jgi:hypothetical protein
MNIRSAINVVTATLAATLFAIACGPSARDGNQVGIDGNTNDDGGGGGGGADAKIEQCQKMDFLFVVDDSASMGEEQTSLSTAFPDFAGLLNDFRLRSGQPLDYRLAVTTTGRTVNYKIKPPFGNISIPMNEIGDNGAFRNTCGISRRWLERNDSDLTGKFACRAKVGTGGPTWEMPMITTMQALKERMMDGTNTGFLRSDALLAVVIVTDEDDCSRRDNNFTAASDSDGCAVMPAELVTFFDNVKGARNRWAAAIVAGPGPGTCESTYGKAFEATRLKEFITMANASTQVPSAVFSSICDGNMAASLGQALSTFETACENFTVE